MRRKRTGNEVKGGCTARELLFLPETEVRPDSRELGGQI